MQPRLSRLLFSTSATLALLVVLEIVTSALMPALGWRESRLAFNVVIILFMAIRVDTPILPWFIMLLQLVHAAFSVEGWALGTLAGIFSALTAGYLKEVLQFSSAFATIIIVQLFQVLWYLLTVSTICLKIGNFDKFNLLFWNALPGSFLLSLVSPLLFGVLARLWSVEDEVGRTGVRI